MTVFDLFVIVLLLFSGLFAFLRGFIRETATLAALVGAAFFTFRGTPFIVDYLGFSDSMVELIIVYAVAFAASFVILWLVLDMLISGIIGKNPHSFDRLLGAVFGFARGYLLIGLIFLTFEYYMESEGEPEMVEKAWTRGLAKSAANTLEAWGIKELSTVTEAVNDGDGQ